MTEQDLLKGRLQGIRSGQLSIAQSTFQKCICGDKPEKKLYFINVYKYDSVGVLGETYDADVNFYEADEEEAWVVIQCHGIRNWSVGARGLLQGQLVAHGRDKHNND
jgi:GH18 family chitinase